MNSAFSDKKKKIVRKSKFIYDKKMTANIYSNSTFQVNRTKNATGKRRFTSSNRATAVSSEATNLFLALNLAR